MIRNVNATPSPPGSRCGSRGGFTLVELLIVIIVLAILVGLLLPVIAGAVRTARNAAVQAEINQLAQALANFKATYGDYPPSRVLLVENGNYAPFIDSNSGQHDRPERLAERHRPSASWPSGR